MNLTSRTYLLAALTALLGVVETWSAASPIAWRLAAAALVAALLYEWLVVRTAGVGITPVASHDLALGRRESVSLRLSNPTSRPLAVLFAPALPEAIEFDPQPRRVVVAPSSTFTDTVEVRPVKLGEHHWHGVPFRVLGPLGLGWWSRHAMLDVAVKVVPDLLRGAVESQGSREGGTARRTLPGGGAELHQLREYRPGDPRHTLDWKATARAGSLITRVFGEDQHLEIVVVLDVGRTSATRVAGLSQLGHFVNATARFTEHAVAADDRVAVVAVSDRLLASTPPQRGLEGVLRARRLLARLEAQPVETDLLRGVMEVQRLVRHRALVIVLTDLYGQDTGGRLARSVGLLLPRHLPVVVGLVGEELAEMAHAPARRWIDPYLSLAAQEYRTRISRNAAGLRRQGAWSLVTTPALLDAEVLTLYRRLKAERRV